jgi:hypothetical protein
VSDPNHAIAREDKVIEAGRASKLPSLRWLGRVL